MKKRLVAVVAALFASTLLWSGAAASSQAGNGNDWERRPASTHLAGGSGNDWEFHSDSSSAHGNDWE